MRLFILLMFLSFGVQAQGPYTFAGQCTGPMAWDEPVTGPQQGYHVRWGNLVGNHPNIVDVGPVLSVTCAAVGITLPGFYTIVINAYLDNPVTGARDLSGDTNEIEVTITAPQFVLGDPSNLRFP